MAKLPIRDPARASLALFLALALSARAAAAGQAISASLFEPDPGFAGLGSEAEPLALSRLIDAAFLASGVGAERLPGYESRLSAILAELSKEPASLADPADEAALGEAVLAFLHKRVFKAYEADATTLDLVLDSGRYNCVSSALLYLIAARSLGLDARGVRTSDHAFCSLPAGPEGGRDIDVETTNRYGFDPGNKKEFKDSFGKVTGYAYSPPGAYSRRERVADATFIGLVLSNRAGALERSGRYLEALRLGADLDALAPGAESRAFLLDRVGNVVADLSRKRDYAGARAFADLARAELGDSARLAELSRDAAMNEAAALAQAGRWDEALDRAAEIGAAQSAAGSAARKELGSLVETCVGNLLSARLRTSDFAGARSLLEARRGLLDAALGPASASAAAALERRVAEAELSRAVETLPFAEALAAAELALASGSVSRSRWEEAVAYLYGNEANRLAAAGENLGAAALAEAGAARAPGRSGQLSRFAAELRRAFAARAHNEFARYYNAGDYARALETIRAALELLPGEASLKADLELARKAAASP